MRKIRNLKFRWLGGSCFEIMLPEQIYILLDPFLDYSNESVIHTENLKRIDYILLSNISVEHGGIECTKIANNKHSNVFCNKESLVILKKLYKIKPEVLNVVSSDDRILIENSEIKILKGYKNFISLEDSYNFYRNNINDKNILEKIENHLEHFKSDLDYNLIFNFKITLNKKFSLFFYNSNYNNEEITKQLIDNNIDILITSYKRLSEDKAIKSAIKSKAKIVIPQHFNRYFKNIETPDVEYFKKEIEENSNSKVIIPEMGRFIYLNDIYKYLNHNISN